MQCQHDQAIFPVYDYKPIKPDSNEVARFLDHLSQFKTVDQEITEYYTKFESTIKRLKEHTKLHRARKDAVPSKVQHFLSVSNTTPGGRSHNKTTTPVCLGEAPGELALSIYYDTLINPGRMFIQTYIPGLTSLNSYQQKKWDRLLDFKDTVYVNYSKNKEQCNGDLTNYSCTNFCLNQVCLGKLINQRPPRTCDGHHHILTCDAGADRQEIEIDDYAIIKNIIAHPTTKFYDVIVLKSQNFFRHSGEELLDFIGFLKYRADTEQLALDFLKPASSWIGNSEVYVCFWNPRTVISKANPLSGHKPDIWFSLTRQLYSATAELNFAKFYATTSQN